MTHPCLVLQHPERWASANAGHAGDEDEPAGAARAVLGSLVRVLPGEQVALVGDNVISVMQG